MPKRKQKQLENEFTENEIDDNIFLVERILGKRFKSRKAQYLIKWAGYAE